MRTFEWEMWSSRFNEAEGSTVRSVVSNVFVSQAQTLIELEVDDGPGAVRVVGTPTHPFWVVGRGWTEMAAIREGDWLRRVDGVGVSVVAVSSRSEGATVYNLEVADTHTYFVTEQDLLVHNRCLVAADFGLPDSYFSSIRGEFSIGCGSSPTTGFA